MWRPALLPLTRFLIPSSDTRFRTSSLTRWAKLASLSLYSSLTVYLIGETLERFSRAGPRGRGREWATLGVHPLSWLLSNNRLEKVPFVSVLHTSSNRLLLSNQDKGCTPSVAHSLPLPLGPALLSLWIIIMLRIRCWGVQNYVIVSINELVQSSRWPILVCVIM